MAIANLLVKIGADIAELKTGSDKAVATMEKTSGRIDSIASSIKSTLIGAFSINAVINFGQELLRMGDDIVRTADRTGLLTDEVQRLSFIASQSGNSIEEITGAIGQMQNRLASGDKSAVAAVKALGLSFDDLRRMNPYDQMAAIADVIGKIPDPATRAQVAMDLFGRSGIALLPTLTAKFRELGEAAPIMSEDTVRALDAAGDSFDKLTLTVKVFAANLYNYAGKAFDNLIASFYRMIGGLYEGTAKLVQLTSKIPGSSKVFGDLNDNIASLTQTSHWYRDAASSLEAGAVKAARTVNTQYNPAITAAGKAHQATTGHTKAHVAVLKEEAAVLPEVQHALDLVAIAHQHQVAALQLETSAFQATQRASENYIQHLTTANVVLLDGVRNLSSMVPAIGAAAEATGNLTSAMDAGTQASARWTGAVMAGVNGLVGSLAQAFQGSGGILQGFKNFGTQTATDFVAGLLSAIPLIGPALSLFAKPIVDGFKAIGHAIADVFDRNKGRDLVVEFAETFEGGFNGLHARLLTLGDAGEQLWIRFTQGVGRNNPGQARAAIDAITEAFRQQAGSVNVLSGTLDDFGDSLDDLGRRDVRIPIRFDVDDIALPGGSTPGYATGTRGQYVDFGAGTMAMLHGRERVVTEGEQLGVEAGEVHVYIGNEQLDSRTVRVTRKDAARGGLRARAAHGRSW